jgi:PKD repeat protein
MTFRHMANQISCYQVRESPGSAYCYNDWQMALFWDTLFLKVYGATYSNVDASVFHPKLTDILRCEDNPTMMAFGTGDRPGRVGISIRDHARFGLLYMRQGNWNGTQVLSSANATTAVTSPLPLSIPQSAGQLAEMCPGQRTLGSSSTPDNQTDHHGSYSWLWWVNGVKRDGTRMWADAPTNVFTALGHANGKRGVAVMPTQEIVLAYNDTTLDTRPSNPHPLNEVFKLLLQSLTTADQPPAISSLSASPNSGTAPLTVGFSAAATDPEGQPLTYQWDFQNDGTPDATGQNPQFTYTTAGSYTAVVRVSDGTNVTTGQVAVTVTAPSGPAAPSNLAATAVSSTRVDLTWTDNSTNETGFKIERATGASGTLSVTLSVYNGTNTAPTVEAAGSANSFKIGALVVNDRADTWTAVPASLSEAARLLTARNDRQQSPTDSKYVVSVSGPCTIYLPLDPRYGGARTSWMDASWTDSGFTCDSSALAGWKIWQKSIAAAGSVTLGCDTTVADGVAYAFVGSGSWIQIAQVGANVTTYSDTGLSAGTMYSYRVRATNANGSSAYSNVASATTPSLAPDSDADGLPDSWEMQYFSSLAEPASGDPDNDTLSNLQEYQAGTNPIAADTDGDALTDAQELGTVQTNPTLADSDGDGMSDGAEVGFSFDPRAADQDSNGTLDGQDDWDLDGTPNATDPTPGNPPAPSGGGGGGGGGGCGATGLEALLVLALLRFRRHVAQGSSV